MLSVGIAPHQGMRYAGIRDEKENRLWRGKIRNIKEDFEFLIDKIDKVQNSNNDTVEFIFMNPTDNYHVPLKYFLKNNNFTVYMVYARKTLHLRKIMNLNTIKSDSEDEHILAAALWHDPKYREYTDLYSIDSSTGLAILY